MPAHAAASQPQPYDADALIRLALNRGVLKFGEFTLKSGRQSPYFFNAGLLNDGEALSLLAEGYAQTLMACKSVGVLFGPAYKGIPLVAATASALWHAHGVNVPWAFNRKEAKTHGEGGVLVGASVSGQSVWILDDVMTAGTAIREAIELIQQGGGMVGGIVVALDRQERGQREQSAVQEVAAEFDIPVQALLTLDKLIEYLAQTDQADYLTKMQSYRAQYGVKVAD